MRVAGRLGLRSARLHHAVRQGGRHHRRTRPPVPRIHGQRAGHDPGAAELLPARLHALPESDLHLGQRRRSATASRATRCSRTATSVNLDITVIKDGYHGDNSRMFFIGEPSILARACPRSPTSACGWASRKVKPGAHLGDIGHAIQQHAEKPATAWCASSAATASARSSTKSRKCCTTAAGHAGKAPAGMIFTIEPMINAGRRDIREMPRRLDHQDQGPQPVGAVGAHGPGHRDRLRGADRCRPAPRRRRPSSRRSPRPERRGSGRRDR
jgi:hypothetical protein